MTLLVDSRPEKGNEIVKAPLSVYSVHTLYPEALLTLPHIMVIVLFSTVALTPVGGGGARGEMRLT